MRPNRYLAAIRQRIDMLEGQWEAIDRAAAICAERIAEGRLVHVFGAGHSRMVAEEAYPRIGAVLGFRPVVELALTYFHPVAGPNGLRQAIFLERVPDYGRLLFDELYADQRDAVIVVSSSGVEAVIHDFVAAAHDRGLPVIGITSSAYSAAASRQRGGVKRLADVADVVIDNCAPAGDALVDIEGIAERVGASASILGLTVIDSIAVRTAERMHEAGVDPIVFASPHLVGLSQSSERMDASLREYRRRIGASLMATPRP